MPKKEQSQTLYKNDNKLMMKNGDNTNYIKDIVNNVKRLLSGQADKEQKDLLEPKTNKNCEVTKNPSVFKIGLIHLVL